MAIQAVTKINKACPCACMIIGAHSEADGNKLVL